MQGIGAAFLLANAAAIITDAFPANQRGMALGINNIVGVSGMFIGLVLGGLLAPIDWRLVFLISVPVGLFGTVWAYLKLEERSTPKPARVDWWGNVTFALGLILIMVAVTYGIRPYGSHATGWGSPRVLALLGAGVAFLAAFAVIERRVAEPMFRLPLFRIRAFTFGTLSTFLSAIARGGLMFMLIIWLQGIWLPLHGYNFTDTPLWAGIYMLPLTDRHADRRADLRLPLRPLRRALVRDRRDARLGAELLPADAAADRLLLPAVRARCSLMVGVSMGMFASPNRAAVMNSLPPQHRGAGGGMNQTFQNSAQVLSIGIFFTLMIIGLASNLPHTLSSGLEAHGVSAAAAAQRRAHAAGVGPVRRVPRLQPDRAPRRPARARRALGRQPRGAHRALVLPAPDLRAVPQRPARGVPVRDPRLPDRGRRVADARRQVSLRRADACALRRRRRPGRAPRGAGRRRSGGVGDSPAELRARRERARANYDSRGAACALSGTGSRRFILSAADATVAIDPFADMSAMAASRGMQFDYPPIEGVEADLLLVTHEHIDHNGVEAIGGEPTILRSTAGRLESPLGEITAIASEHDERAGTERGPNTIFVFELDGLRVAHFGDFGQSALREEQTEAIGAVDLLILPVGAGPTIGAEQAAEIVERLSPRWVVPMHYRTAAHRLPRDGRCVPRALGARRASRRQRVRDRRAARGRGPARRRAGGAVAVGV